MYFFKSRLPHLNYGPPTGVTLFSYVSTPVILSPRRRVDVIDNAYFLLVSKSLRSLRLLIWVSESFDMIGCGGNTFSTP
jgi:hypothetical protein